MASFRFRPEGLAKLRNQKRGAEGIQSDPGFADTIGVHRTTVYRVIHEGKSPGIGVLAGAMLAFGAHWFNDLFEAVHDDETDALANKAAS